MQKKTIVAARYVRNSDSSKMDTEVQQAQADALKAYADKMGWECPDTLLYKDAISALKHPYWERPGLMQSWDDAERGMFNVVLCTEFFRVARTTAEQYAVIEYFKRFKVELISITEKFEDTPEGQLMFMLQGWLGSLEANKIAIRTARGKAHRASRALTGQGKYPTYGYLWVDGEEYTRERYELNLTVIHIDEFGREWTEVRVIEFSYDEYLRGQSLYQLAFSLTRLGIPTREGKKAWDPSTIRRFLTNVCYTGAGVNGRYAAEQIPIKGNVYPKIIEPEMFEEVQKQLKIHAEMSLRNNQHPKDGILRGIIFCGICGHKMQVKHFNNPGKRHRYVKATEYRCYQNNGLEGIENHHAVTIRLDTLDKDTWDILVPYIKNEQAVRAHIESLRTNAKPRNYSEDLERDIARINKSVANLYALAEAADPNDRDGMEAFQIRLVALQNDKREKEKLLGAMENTQEKTEKFLAALARFEAWTQKVRPFLNDPDYTVSFDDMREAVLVMGVKAIVYPASEEYEERVKITFFPPDIGRFSDCDFTK
jgi:site-specific DNA recombinase